MHLVFVLLCGATIPRIKPVTSLQARMATLTWLNDNTISDERQKEIRMSERMYRVPSSESIGCVSVQSDHVIQAVALLEVVNSHILVWNVESGDMTSATLLIAAIRRDPKHTFVLTPTLHDRWRIAFSFFTDPSSPLPPGAPPRSPPPFRPSPPQRP